MRNAIDELFARTRSARGFGLGDPVPAANTGTQRTATARTGRPGSAASMAAGAAQFTPGVPDRQREPSTAPADRVQRALEIYQQPVQDNRQTAEASVNPQIAESLRLGLIEQERLRKAAQDPSLGAVARRALYREMELNQAGIDAGLRGVGDIRTGQVTARGADLNSATTLAEREAMEAGAFDRSLLDIDKTRVTGQYGLGQAYLSGSLQNEGLVAQQTALNPLEQAQLRIGMGLEEGVSQLPDDLQARGYAQLGDFYAGNAGIGGAYGPQTTTYTDAAGNEQTGPTEEVMVYRWFYDPLYRKTLEAQGFYMDPKTGALARAIGGKEGESERSVPARGEDTREFLRELGRARGGL